MIAGLQLLTVGYTNQRTSSISSPSVRNVMRADTLPSACGSNLTPRPCEPSLKDSSGQGSVCDATFSGEGTENLQILLVEAERDLLGARRANLDVEILEILCELLHAVTRQKVTLFSIASERWKFAFLCSHRAH
jgi:hypothetical protein